jgi:hypothetical protein
VQDQYKIDPNHVRSLRPGEAFVISRGRAMKVAVLRAPEARAELPEAASTPTEAESVPQGRLLSEELARLPF